MMKETEKTGIRNAISELDCTWEMNPATGSHFGGVWEKPIGSIKRILTAATSQMRNHTLHRDELHTLFLEACRIVNSTPLYEASADPNEPYPVSPSHLLTLKDMANPPPPEKFSKEELLLWKKTMAPS